MNRLEILVTISVLLQIMQIWRRPVIDRRFSRVRRIQDAKNAR